MRLKSLRQPGDIVACPIGEACGAASESGAASETEAAWAAAPAYAAALASTQQARSQRRVFSPMPCPPPRSPNLAKRVAALEARVGVSASARRMPSMPRLTELEALAGIITIPHNQIAMRLESLEAWADQNDL